MVDSRAGGSHIQYAEFTGWSPSLPLCGINFRELEPMPWLWRAGKGRSFSCGFSKNICSSKPLLVSEKLKDRIIPTG